jgi:hypothetical protein
MGNADDTSRANDSGAGIERIGIDGEREYLFRLRYTAAEERRYVRLPFEVPDGIGRIECAYAYPRFENETRPDGFERIEANIADIGLLDERGKLRGWSGSNRTEIMVSAETATPGYRAGEIRPGRWAVALGIYRVRTSVEIELTVRLLPKRRVLLAGDLHMHTDNSDGAYPTAKVIEYARAAGLDYIALTDHNNTAQNREIGRTDGIVVIPGMEYTNYRGHANLYFPEGPGEFDEDPFSGSFDEMRGVLELARERGAYISLNHPHCSNCPWEFGFDGLPYDMVEVWNGPMKPSEIAAISWWHDRLSRGVRLPAVGGSDTHRHEPLRSYGVPTTFVHAMSRSRKDILTALLEGRSFITFTRDGPQLELTVDGARLGEAAPVSKDLEGEATVRGSRPGDLLAVFDGAGGRREYTVPYEGEYSVRFPAESGAKFYRIELYRELLPGLRMLCALTNPVFMA